MSTDQLPKGATTSSPVASAPLARLLDIGFTYPNGTVAIGRLSLNVYAGSTVAVVGPSGCGKSTLLSIIAGFHSPSAGSVTWEDTSEDRHPISMVFQKDTLLPWLTVEENVRQHERLSSRRQRLARSESTIGVGELLEMCALSHCADKYPYQLSGGMRRRVAFLSAVAPMPRLLLLDEPFSSLDEPTRIAIHQDVFRIARQFKIAVVLVTHDLAEAASLSDDVIILSKSPAEIVSSHSVPFGDDRTMVDLRHDERFLKLYAALWEDLSAQI